MADELDIPRVDYSDLKPVKNEEPKENNFMDLFE
jgi:hypothetical protein